MLNESAMQLVMEWELEKNRTTKATTDYMAMSGLAPKPAGTAVPEQAADSSVAELSEADFESDTDEPTSAPAVEQAKAA